MDEMIDVVKALVYTKPGTGRRVGLVAMTGGQSVVIADAFGREGLEVPLLTDASYGKLASFFTIIGGSYRNPFDSGHTIGFRGQPDNLPRLLDILDEDANIDAVVMEIGTGFMARRWQQDPSSLDRLLDTLVDFQQRSAKPFITILHPAHLEAVAAEARAKVTARGLPAFTSFQRGARALRKAIDYHRFRAGLD